jgi:NTE family protein
LASSEYLPDWVAGISIGAINAAIIAGNRPDDRLKHLRTFRNEITSRTSSWPDGLGWPFAAWQPQVSAFMAVMYGQPGFFAPRHVHDWFSPKRRVSYYDTSALKGTLERLVDFERINKARDIRLSVGAVNVWTGQFTYFDSVKMPIRAEHYGERRTAARISTDRNRRRILLGWRPVFKHASRIRYRLLTAAQPADISSRRISACGMVTDQS